MHQNLARDFPECVGDRPAMMRHVSRRQERRNAAGVRAEWQFTTADARTKLRKLYPIIDE
jgi:hypothetical protein